jgi:PhoPQ-activated pathogenicity-related protein
MDAIEQLAAKEWQGKIDGFVITGASKRGWTSWLTPVADKRIIATAPMVIDVLNFRPQMKHQMETWGRFSEQIEDYTRKGLVKLGEETPRDTQLRQMMDPYTYRSRLSLPKLLINGTNDRYWVVDATRFYWDDLIGPKYLLAVPNAGHGLDGGRELALRTLAVFFQHAVTHTALPALDAHYSSENGTLRLKVASTPEPRAAQLWTATSDTKDFRGAKWSPHSMQQHEGSYLGEVERPAGGHAAVFGELQFEYQGVPYSLTTLVRWE